MRLLSTIAVSILFLAPGLCAAAELEVVDKLTVSGYAVLNSSAEVAGLLGVSTGAPQAALDVVSTGTASNVYAQIWRDGGGVIVASMTSQGTLYATLPPGTGDNLGDHTATRNLNMAAFDVIGVSTVSVSSITTAAAGVTFSTNVYLAAGRLGIGTAAPWGALAIKQKYGYVSVSTTGASPGTFVDIVHGVSQSADVLNVGTSDSGDVMNVTTNGTNFNQPVAVNAWTSTEGLTVDQGSTGRVLNITKGGGATSLLTIPNSGRVGIGTASPAAALHVQNSATANVVQISTGAAAAQNILTLSKYGRLQVGPSGSYYGIPSYNLVVDTSPANGLPLVYVGSLPSDTQLTSGAGFSVQIGNSGTKLLVGDGGANVRLGSDSGGNAWVTADFGSANANFQVGPSLYQRSSGVAGLGVTNPLAMLDVKSTGTASNVYAQIWRDGSGVIVASMTSQGKLYADISGATGIPSGDNLGNHTATRDLSLSGFDIVGVSTISVSSITTAAAGVTLSTNLFVNGSVGIGTTAPSALLDISGAVTNPIPAVNSAVGYRTGWIKPSYVQNVSEDSPWNGYMTSFMVSPVMTGAGNISGLAGINSSVNYSGTGTFTDNLNAIEAVPNIHGGSIPVVRGLTSWGSMSAGSVTEWDSLNAQDAYRTGGTIQNLYGVKVDNLSSGTNNYAVATAQAAGANNYALYNSGGAKSYFAGEVGLGISAPSAKLDVVSTGTAVDVYAQIWRNGSGVIVGSMSATGVLEAARFVGDGSGLTGVAGGTSGPSIDVSTVNATASTPYGGVNVSTNVFVAGRLGVGTRSPGYAVHAVVSTAEATSLMISTGTGANDYILKLSSSGVLYAKAGVTYAGDLAEMYPSLDDAGAADVVMMAADGGAVRVRKAVAGRGRVLGVVSTAPGVTIGTGDLGEHKGAVPVALSGRVPVRVSAENGPVRAGDFLGASSRPGRAARAAGSGMVIGMALEDQAPGRDYVLCFVNPQYWVDPSEFERLREELDELKKGRRY